MLSSFGPECVGSGLRAIRIIEHPARSRSLQFCNTGNMAGGGATVSLEVCPVTLLKVVLVRFPNFSRFVQCPARLVVAIRVQRQAGVQRSRTSLYFDCCTLNNRADLSSFEVVRTWD
jgi:hypothetical protein